MIKKEPYKKHLATPFDLILGSFHFDDTIATVTKSSTMWFNQDLDLIKSDKKENKLVHPVNKYRTLEISYQDELQLY